MKLGIPRETTTGETRVAGTPETVKKLIALGLEVLVGAGAGDGASIPDAAFVDAGATIVDDPASLLSQADIVLVATPPDAAAARTMGSGTVVIGLLDPHSDPARLQAYADAGITTLSMERLPRISRAQSMDVLSSQSNIAGYGAVLIAAERYSRLFPMMMTAAGTIPAARVLILGAGVAGLQAIATARRLGAVVSAYDVRPEVGEQVESLGGKFLAVATDDADAAAPSVYAKEMSDDYKVKEQAMLAEQMARTNIVITTALIPGRPAPRLLSETLIDGLAPGSVVVDLAAGSGGNCAYSVADEVVEHNGITLFGPTNLPAHWGADASHLLSRNLLTFLTPLIADQGARIDLAADPELVDPCMLTHDGKPFEAAPPAPTPPVEETREESS